MGDDRWLAGGLRTRVDLDAGRVELAPQVAQEPLFAVRFDDTWVFLAAESGRAYRAETFLGDLTPHGEAPAGLNPCLGDPTAPLHLVGRDGHVYQVSGDAPLRRVDALDDLYATGCFADAAGHRFVYGARGGRRSDDRGERWGPMDEDPDALHARRAAAMEALRGTPGGVWVTDAWDADADRVHPLILQARDEARLWAEAEGGPQPDCTVAAPWLAVCDGVLFVVNDSGWRRVVESRLRPRLSLDGRRALLLSGCAGEEAALCLLDEGAPPRTLSRPPALDDGVLPDAFDGDRVYLVREAGLEVVDLQTGTARTVPFDDAVGQVWRVMPTSDAPLVLAASREGPPRLFVMGSDETRALPAATGDACLLDGTRGIARTRSGEIWVTHDAGRRWERASVATRPARSSLQCPPGRGRAEGDRLEAALVEADLPAPPLRPLPLPRFGPSLRLRCESRGPGRLHRDVEAESEGPTVRVSVTWHAGGAARSGAGPLPLPEPAEASEGTWEILAVTPRAALLGWDRAARRRLVHVPDGGRPQVVDDEANPRDTAWPGLEGSIVLGQGPTHRVVGADGRVREVAEEVRPGHLRFRPDGSVSSLSVGRRHDGGIRLGSPDAPPVEVRAGTLRVCAPDFTPTERYVVSSGVSLDLALEGRRPEPAWVLATDTIIDRSADGAFCVRRLRYGEVELEAHDGALHGPDRRRCRLADGAP